MSTIFTPKTLLRFSFLPCAATLHAKTSLLMLFVGQAQIEKSYRKSR